jgi:hypothetical protein
LQCLSFAIISGILRPRWHGPGSTSVFCDKPHPKRTFVAYDREDDRKHSEDRGYWVEQVSLFETEEHRSEIPVSAFPDVDRDIATSSYLLEVDTVIEQPKNEKQQLTPHIFTKHINLDSAAKDLEDLLGWLQEKSGATNPVCVPKIFKDDTVAQLRLQEARSAVPRDKKALAKVIEGLDNFDWTPCISGSREWDKRGVRYSDLHGPVFGRL